MDVTLPLPTREALANAGYASSPKSPGTGDVAILRLAIGLVMRGSSLDHPKIRAGLLSAFRAQRHAHTFTREHCALMEVSKQRSPEVFEALTMEFAQASASKLRQ